MHLLAERFIFEPWWSVFLFSERRNQYLAYVTNIASQLATFIFYLHVCSLWFWLPSSFLVGKIPFNHGTVMSSQWARVHPITAICWVSQPFNRKNGTQVPCAGISARQAVNCRAEPAGTPHSSPFRSLFSACKTLLAASPRRWTILQCRRLTRTNRSEKLF